MRNFTSTFVLPIILALGGCAGAQSSQIQTQVAARANGEPLSYSPNDSATDVARDIAQQFPQLSAFGRYPRTATDSIGVIESTGLIATQDSNKVHLDYRHTRTLTGGPTNTQISTSTLCDLTVMPVQGKPGSFTVTPSLVFEKKGRDPLFVPLKPIAPAEQIASDIGNSLSKLRQTETEVDVSRLEKDAAAGDSTAQFRVGIMYSTGQGVPVDYAEAVKWIRKAADQGHAGAEYKLGYWYEKGLFVPQDYKAAVAWYRKAAEMGVADAQNNLGVLYGNGEGILQDYAQAYKWLMLAKANSIQGSETYNLAGHIMEVYAKRMTPNQLAWAQKEASSWMSAHPDWH